ncbi:transporter (plasmid) [Frondihabitans sp. PAMC 28766]|uniref:BON domain-containing protein n=1 Tax=Frondihabitans sp. PAMC 28766 TaxID=1795630 RepID=UPI00078B93EA|nr:BON domain-containing protein [Frondihabitans sp. PAMC 28766]AMM22706.1 transporter [Frondihabitans sp. PAMC 28766]
MTTSTLIKSDRDIQEAVQEELAWTPDVDDAGIGVAVENGVVTLSGEVDDAAERIAAGKAAFRTSGVTTVVEDIVIHPSSYVWTVTETDIAKNVQTAIRWVATLPDSVTATVEKHTVTLKGQVEWNYQREEARRAVEAVKGVVFVVNEIILRSRPSVANTEDRIRKALVRNATIDANQVHVAVSGNTATLTGQVRSYVERKQAETAAWASPHVTHVNNDISITL